MTFWTGVLAGVLAFWFWRRRRARKRRQQQEMTIENPSRFRGRTFC